MYNVYKYLDNHSQYNIIMNSEILDLILGIVLKYAHHSLNSVNTTNDENDDKTSEYIFTNFFYIIFKTVNSIFFFFNDKQIIKAIQ